MSSWCCSTEKAPSDLCLVQGWSLPLAVFCRHHNGVFVLGVVAGSPADRSDMLQKGDHLLEINGVDMRHATVDMVAQMLMDASGDVVLVVERLQAAGGSALSRSDLTCEGEGREGKMWGSGGGEGGEVVGEGSGGGRGR